MNTYARAGQRIAGRFDLVYPYTHQLFDHASSWIARDVVLSSQVRATVIDPTSDRASAAVDAARRAALVVDPHLVAIVQVVTGDVHAIITEIPPGSPVAERLDGTPVDPAQVHAIVGEASSAIATGTRRGVRHLQATARTIYLTNEGDVVVDGLGVDAALAGADTRKDSADLDRDEARGLTVLMAALLLGRDLPAPAEHDTVIGEALRLDLPPVLESVLRREFEGDGAISPADLTRRLVPWGEITALPPVSSQPAGAETITMDALDMPEIPHHTPSTPTWPSLGRPAAGAAAGGAAAGAVAGGTGVAGAVADAANVAVADAEDNAVAADSAHAAGSADVEDVAGGADAHAADADADLPARATSRQEAAQLVDEELGVDGRGKLTAPVAWPGLDQAAHASAADAHAGDAANSADGSAEAAGPAEPATEPTTEPATPSLPSEPQTTPTPPAYVPQRVPAATEGDETAGATPTASLTRYSDERAQTFNTSRVVIALFTVGVVFFGWLGIRALTAPFDPVVLEDRNPNRTVQPSDDPSGTTAAPQTTDAPAPVIKTAQLVSPDAGLLRGTDPARQDNPSSVPNAVDGNADTAWESWTYTVASMSPMSGIGLYVELEKEATVSEVTLDTVGNKGGNIQIRDTVKDAPSAGKILAEGPVEAATTFKLSEPLSASSFVIWITELPLNSAGEPQIKISEIHVK
ncbi:hypothetical protein INS90_10940 [Trueperella pecoris]|uniref:Peptidoglycan biosynthesis protein MviN n=1 Tax=Trueperella pecoris TaxID=2733571 RepID=A0A7M1R0C9_9ACTO|nr:hypothetical protein [Trueperella pecoris]QOR47730.1 hypothetical protein INS90_10940 [Trueperella pecoris]